MDLQQLIEECKKHGIDIGQLLPKTAPHQFSVIVRYNRGLGTEYLNLLPVTAMTPGEAQTLADDQAAAHFKITPGLEKAVIDEVKIRPKP